MRASKEYAIKLLNEEEVTIEEMAKVAHDIQAKYTPKITIEETINAVNKVLEKTEVINTIIFAIEQDRMTREKKHIDPYIQEVLEQDDGLFGLDEVMALNICNLFGSIALTVYGWVDKEKWGIIKKLDEKPRHNVFLDDVVGAIIASSVALLAHAQNGKIYRREL